MVSSNAAKAGKKATRVEATGMSALVENTSPQAIRDAKRYRERQARRRGETQGAAVTATPRSLAFRKNTATAGGVELVLPLH